MDTRAGNMQADIAAVVEKAMSEGIRVVDVDQVVEEIVGVYAHVPREQVLRMAVRAVTLKGGAAIWTEH